MNILKNTMQPLKMIKINFNKETLAFYFDFILLILSNLLNIFNIEYF